MLSRIQPSWGFYLGLYILISSDPGGTSNLTATDVPAIESNLELVKCMTVGAKQSAACLFWHRFRLATDEQKKLGQGKNIGTNMNC